MVLFDEKGRNSSDFKVLALPGKKDIPGRGQCYKKIYS